MSIHNFATSNLAGSSAQAGGFYDHPLPDSLRFTDESNTSLTRVFATDGNRKTWTWSAWIKRGNIDTQQRFWATTNGTSQEENIRFEANNTIRWYCHNAGGSAADNDLSTVAVFRDVTSWYHIQIVKDTTESTDSNRNKLYVNGVLQSWAGTNYASLNYDGWINASGSDNNHRIGGHALGAGTSNMFDGYMSDVHFVDGQALAPTSFGETKDGIWIPKEYSGSHGTNGFHLPFSVTQGKSVNFPAGSQNIRFSSATQYDIASGDDFCLEFFIKADLEAKTMYAIGQYATAGPHFMLQLGSGTTGNIYAYYGNGLANNFDTTAYMTTTDWHHFAYVRESGTYRFYIDGVQRHTATNGGTAAFDLSQFNVGEAFAAGGSLFDGKLSNLRFTIGAARYGGGTTFTVPTSTLTNDSSNVKLLAFTTSTITADASSAAISGSIPTGVPLFDEDNPFSVTIGNDAAGSNNFSDSGLSFTDIVLDTTTNNFCVGNPLSSRSNNTFTEGNLKITGSGVNYYNSIASMGMEPGGKYYFEVYSNRRDGSYWAVGIIKPGVFYHLQSVYNTAGLMAFVQGQYVKYLNNTIGSTPNRYNTTPYLFSFAIDLENYIFHLRADNGSWENSGDPAGGTGGFPIAAAMQGETLIPFLAPNGANYMTLNFGQDSSFAGQPDTVPQGNTDANGIGDFYYAPPSGFLALCSANLETPTIGPDKPTQADDYFNTVTYTGTGASNSITVGFQPDFTWIKQRSGAAFHNLFDSLRVVGGDHKRLYTNSNIAEESSTYSGTTNLTSLDSDGFSLGTGTDTNNNGSTYAAWNWLAGGTPTATNSAGAGNVPTSGSVLIDGVASTSTLAGTIAANKITANTAAGFSIINYTGNGLSGQTVAHGLSSTPEFLIHKDRGTNSNNNQWNIYHAGAGDKYGYFLTNAFTGAAQIIPNGTDTIELKANITTSNQSGNSFIMYAFHSVDGFSKVGSYIGTGVVDGAFVYTGFRPAFVLTKRSDNTSWWGISDSKRSPNNEIANTLAADQTYSESQLTSDMNVDFLSNGFKIRDTDGYYNATNASYIYLAFAEQPFKFANAR